MSSITTEAPYLLRTKLSTLMNNYLGKSESGERSKKRLLFIGIAALLGSLISIPHANALVVPTAPTNISVTAAAGALVVSWQPPQYDSNSVTAYSIEYSSTGSAPWTVASNSIAASARNYTISSLNPGTYYFVRMTALNGASASPYGYPWTPIYSTSTTNRDANSKIVYDSGGGLGGSDSASVVQSAMTAGGYGFTRVKYHMEYKQSSALVYADADMAKWDTSTIPYNSQTSYGASISSLRVPSSAAADLFQVQTNVNDLTVVSSLSTLNVSNKVGRLEIWPYNYAQGVSGLSYPGNASNYDLDDQYISGGYYGSFQVHDVTDSNTILAWNDHANGVTPDVGIGTMSGGNPDWTFCGTQTPLCTSWSAFHLYIYINIPATPTNPNSSSVSLNVAASTSFRTATSIVANTSLSGKVTFYSNGKRIPGCISLPTVTNNGVNPATYSTTCSWRPSVHGQNNVTATFTPYVGPTSRGASLTPITTTSRTTTR